MTNSKKIRLTTEQQEGSALAALGFLSTQEAAALPQHAIVEMREAAALVAETIVPVAPPPALRTRLMSRIANFESLRPIADIRGNEDDWLPFVPGIDVKILFKDKETDRRTVLLRMEPGARIPAHRHHDVEQCLVLKGDIRWGDIIYEAGDFVVMGKDTDHPEVHTVNGNLLLLVAGNNEYSRL
jgi:anti-sigma factor ChrR (cupin superfamily)